MSTKIVPFPFSSHLLKVVVNGPGFLSYPRLRGGFVTRSRPFHPFRLFLSIYIHAHTHIPLHVGFLRFFFFFYRLQPRSLLLLQYSHFASAHNTICLSVCLAVSTVSSGILSGWKCDSSVASSIRYQRSQVNPVGV